MEYGPAIIEEQRWGHSISGQRVCNFMMENRFQLCDRRTQRVLHDTLEIHTLELGRYNLTEADLAAATVLERWLFWLLHAHEYESDDLLRLFPEMAFQQATRTITQISLKTEDKAMYDAREKAIRDHQWEISSALREGEQRGEQRGALMGKIELLQGILGVNATDQQTLRGMTTQQLEALLSELQQSVRSRPSV